MINKYLLLLLFLFAVYSPVSILAEEEVYINEDYLDIEKIREEEYLDENYEIMRMYIFLAVKKGGAYELYTTRGDYDLDDDKKNPIEEPNDLEEYSKLDNNSDKELSIDGDEYKSLITALPNFEELFKEEKLEDPFENGDFMEIEAKASDDDKNRLFGVKTLPIMNADGSSAGIERYVAFYNKKQVETKQKSKDKDGKVTEKVVKKQIVYSYGIIQLIIKETQAETA